MGLVFWFFGYRVEPRPVSGDFKDTTSVVSGPEFHQAAEMD
jgi:hypothetical protein